MTNLDSNFILISMFFQRLFVVLLLLFSCLSSHASEGISVHDLLSRIQINDSPVILDVRSHKEYKKGYIKGAIHIPIKHLSKSLSQISDNQSKQIVVYCYGGPRADKAIQLLEQSGFEQVVELKGHFKAWKQAKLPIELKH